MNTNDNNIKPLNETQQVQLAEDKDILWGALVASLAYDSQLRNNDNSELDTTDRDGMRQALASAGYDIADTFENPEIGIRSVTFRSETTNTIIIGLRGTSVHNFRTGWANVKADAAVGIRMVMELSTEQLTKVEKKIVKAVCIALNSKLSTSIGTSWRRVKCAFLHLLTNIIDFFAPSTTSAPRGDEKNQSQQPPAQQQASWWLKMLGLLPNVAAYFDMNDEELTKREAESFKSISNRLNPNMKPVSNLIQTVVEWMKKQEPTINILRNTLEKLHEVIESQYLFGIQALYVILDLAVDVLGNAGFPNKLISNVDTLSQRILSLHITEITPNADKPPPRLLVVGHSLGGFLAYELGRRINADKCITYNTAPIISFGKSNNETASAENKPNDNETTSAGNKPNDNETINASVTKTTSKTNHQMQVIHVLRRNDIVGSLFPHQGTKVKFLNFHHDVSFHLENNRDKLRDIVTTATGTLPALDSIRETFAEKQKQMERLLQLAQFHGKAENSSLDLTTLTKEKVEQLKQLFPKLSNFASSVSSRSIPTSSSSSPPSTTPKTIEILHQNHSLKRLLTDLVVWGKQENLFRPKDRDNCKDEIHQHLDNLDLHPNEGGVRELDETEIWKDGLQKNVNQNKFLHVQEAHALFQKTRETLENIEPELKRLEHSVLEAITGYYSEVKSLQERIPQIASSSKKIFSHFEKDKGKVSQLVNKLSSLVNTFLTELPKSSKELDKLVREVKPLVEAHNAKHSSWYQAFSRYSLPETVPIPPQFTHLEKFAADIKNILSKLQQSFQHLTVARSISDDQTPISKVIYDKLMKTLSETGDTIKGELVPEFQKTKGLSEIANKVIADSKNLLNKLQEEEAVLKREANEFAELLTSLKDMDKVVATVETQFELIKSKLEEYTKWKTKLSK